MTTVSEKVSTSQHSTRTRAYPVESRKTARRTSWTMATAVVNAGTTIKTVERECVERAGEKRVGKWGMEKRDEKRWVLIQFSTQPPAAPQ